MARAETDLAKAFVTPPDEAKPWVNMFWIGRITPADITQHMEELKAKGAGGANLIDLNAMADAPYMSDNWRRAFQHAVREADRLGLKIGVIDMHAAPADKLQMLPDHVHPNIDGAGELAKAALAVLTGRQPAGQGPTVLPETLTR